MEITERHRARADLTKAPEKRLNEGERIKREHAHQRARAHAESKHIIKIMEMMDCIMGTKETRDRLLYMILANEHE